MLFNPRSLLAALGATLLAGCAIQTGFRASGAPAGEGGVLVLTHAVLHEDGRRDFHRASAEIAATLPTQPGLAGYALRRTLIGDEAWTLTLWRDESARAVFFASDPHRSAMTAHRAALRCARFVRLPWQGPPPDWPRALELLDRHARRYSDSAAGEQACAER